MLVKKQKALHICRLIFGNALRFLFSITFITVFQMLFGAPNILAGVAVSVGITMLPVSDLGIRPLPAAFSILLLYSLCAVVPQFTLLSPWLALPCNFLFVVLILLLMGEPEKLKPSVSFLICFVFCQASPVPAQQLPARFAGLFLGGLLVAACTWIWWIKKGIGRGGRTFLQQVSLCCKSRGYILRMATGIAAAMLTASLLGLKKPLWISIVVMSLTQLDFSQTVERIKHRVVATAIGSVVFLVVFRLLVPQQYAYAMVLLLGYLSYFTAEYKYKQVVNAISAINASLVLLDTTTAIGNRCLCLLGGIVIVLLLYLAERLFLVLKERIHLPAHKNELPSGS